MLKCKLNLWTYCDKIATNVNNGAMPSIDDNGILSKIVGCSNINRFQKGKKMKLQMGISSTNYYYK
jgi:hypothetical protein